MPIDPASRRSFRRPTRRRFLAAGMGAAGLALAGGPLAALAQNGPPSAAGLVPDPAGLLDLPRGLHYRVLMRLGEPLSDGTPRPAATDGMAAFAGPNNTTVLCLNHELRYTGSNAFPVPHVAGDYDPNAIGGTSVLLVGPDRRVRESWISSSGTVRNCSGGATPWGTWITCEENEDLPGASAATRSHGWAFEVDPLAPLGGGTPRQARLGPLGRFYREAVAIDPATGAVYQTEDTFDSLFYRFLPAAGVRPVGFGAYATAGGVLAAASIAGLADANDAEVGRDYTPEWLAVPDLDGDPVKLRHQTYAGMPTRFFRGEGAVWSDLDQAVYFDATGGTNSGVDSGHFGQIWRYTPRTNALRLVYRSDDANVLEMPDNLALLPWGDLVMCEDGGGTDYLRILTRDGRVVDLARNAATASEFAGAAFATSPDTLYVNIQGDGITFAIWGPWGELRG
jgi:secreted PhoX family phosphatase